jgi:hypothetical protein
VTPRWAPQAATDADEGGAARPQVMLVATYLGGLSAFTVDPVTCVPTAAPRSPYDPGAQLYAVSVHPSGRFVLRPTCAARSAPTGWIPIWDHWRRCLALPSPSAARW